MEETYYLIKILEVQYRINPTQQVMELIEELALKQIEKNIEAKQILLAQEKN